MFGEGGSPEEGEEEGEEGLFWTFLLGFGLGLAALLTPCVFPMIPMTVSFFTKQSKTRAEGIRNAVDLTGTTPKRRGQLVDAVRRGRTANVKALLEDGADVNESDRSDATALSIACRMGNAEIVTLLLRWNASVKQPDKHSQPLLLMACQEGHIAIVTALLRSNATVDQARKDGTAPPMCAPAKKTQRRPNWKAQEVLVLCIAQQNCVY